MTEKRTSELWSLCVKERPAHLRPVDSFLSTVSNVHKLLPTDMISQVPSGAGERTIKISDHKTLQNLTKKVPDSHTATFLNIIFIPPYWFSCYLMSAVKDTFRDLKSQ